MKKLKTGIELIAQERLRQIEKEGWTAMHDKQHDNGELSAAAACYAVNKHEKKLRVQVHLPAEINFLVNTGDRGDRRLQPEGWYDAFPFDANCDKRDQHNRIRSLQIAGALIAAEIDRLQQPK